MILNCKITNQNSDILKECVMSKTDPLYKTYGGYHTGLDISGTHIYSVYDGTIVEIGRDDKGHSVIIQTGSSLCMCYTGLLSIQNIRAGQNISSNTMIGTVKKYVHVECLMQSTSMWPVRVGAATWYKQDPTPYIDGSYKAPGDTHLLFDLMDVHLLSDATNGVYNELTKSEEFMLSDNGDPTEDES